MTDKNNNNNITNSDDRDKVLAFINDMRDLEGPLLPLLHRIQDACGYISEESVSLLASGLNLSKAEVHGVISFYHDFHTAATGEHVVQVCRAEACQAMGSRQLEEHAKLSLGVNVGGTTPDGKISLEPVYCLGNCACAPSVRIGDRVHARVDAQRFDTLISALREG